MLAASRQSFAFSRDGALPFSSVLYRMNSYTGTPVNTVFFTAIFSLLLGLLVFAGEQAINAVFAISVTGLYIAYAIPIAARWIWYKSNGWKDGPFSLGWFVSGPPLNHKRASNEPPQLESSVCDHLLPLDGLQRNYLPFPYDNGDRRR